jgi:aminomethyltransferase
MAKESPLYHHHQQLGARMVDFADWKMPIQYDQGTLAEHAAVRNAAGLFDVSHMGEFRFRGPDAAQLLQHLTANDVSALSDGEAQYSLFLNEDGGIIDDIIIYRHTAENFLVVVNAGNLDTDWHWVMAHQTGDVQVTNESHDWALLALQGPKAEAILQPITPQPLSTITRFTFVTAAVSGVVSIIARTGYTGEDGFELFVPAREAGTVWRALLSGGTESELLPCGLAARDTLRLEMAYPLHGHDITAKTSPLETRLGWVVKIGKGDFIGSTPLKALKSAGIARKLVGFRMIDRGIPREGFPIICEGKPKGYVTSGTMSPTLRVGIGLALVPTAYSGEGTKFSIDIRGNERLAEVVKLPFYRQK